jgi:hypothetical protein
MAWPSGSREGTVYDVLRGEISSMLQRALLLRERKQAEEAQERAYAEVEQQVEQRIRVITKNSHR